MKLRVLKLLVLVLLMLVGVATLNLPRGHAQQQGDKPVEQVRKNIQVLKGLPDSQLFPVDELHQDFAWRQLRLLSC